MCGIFGYIGKPDKKTPNMLATLLVLNEDRGIDSAGIVVATDGEVDMYKRAVSASKFIEHDEAIDIICNVAAKPWVTVIGHSRAATRGTVSDENAHPYRIGAYYFAHNGIVSNFDALQTKHQTEYQVDSQIIGHLFNTVGVMKTLEKEIRAWFAVPYFHIENPSRLSIAKSGAPVAFAYLPNNRGMYFSSQRSHLEEALKFCKIKNARIFETTKSKVHSFVWDGKEVKHESEKITPLPYMFTNWEYGKGGGYVSYYGMHDRRDPYNDPPYNTGRGSETIHGAPVDGILTQNEDGTWERIPLDGKFPN